MTDANPPASLREELGAPADPEFELELPEGWARHDVAAETEQRMLQAAKRRLMEAHRPDLYAQLKAQLEESFAAMRKLEAVAHFGPEPGAPDWAFLPASLIATIRTPQPDVSLQQEMAQRIREGATALHDDKRFIRYERETDRMIGTDAAKQRTVVYLTPIPGSKQARALQLTLVITRGAEFPADDPALVTMLRLFDACVATLRWAR
ncbi:hypothetical protein [Agrococcus sp. ARC_14]|uniref:hypothetical protein n=1 Tax=Agrococcus sp. ARC_14 TaxID=2919927 RepID=UPI001F064B18|nr:hypothetical protein [Agrococcus sp. ARC_14]MCH1884135.1 hypothetical protein [Agrococcus sp. ARC_14]